MAGIKKANDFKDKTKIGVITAVDPQKKTVDIKYVSQGGNYKTINLPYNIVGLTWGFVFMPVKGDKVVIGNGEGDRPIIVSMHPNNIDYLPYLDPGEIAMVCENGSYVFGRNKRKRIKSTGELIDYDAQKGPKGETDLEYEPGGLILRARSKKNRDGVTPRWDNHSYLSLFDNGDVSLQSMYAGITKALLFMDGGSGFTFWSAGDGKVQEYIEMNPLKKEMVFFTDGEEHTHVQTDSKASVYGNVVKQLGGGIQINLGLDVSTIPADFDKILADQIGPGDIYIDNHTTQGNGKATLHLKGDFNITLDQGDVNLTTTKGKIVVISKGDVDITTDGDTNVTTKGNTVVNATGDVDVTSKASINIKSKADQIYLNGGVSDTDRIATVGDIRSHVHVGVQNGQGTTSGGDAFGSTVLTPIPYVGKAKGFLG